MNSHDIYKICSEEQGVKVTRTALEIDSPEIKKLAALQKKAQTEGPGVFLIEKFVPVQASDYLDRLSSFNDQVCKRTQNFNS